MPDVGYNIRFAAIELISKSIVEPPINFVGPESFTFNFMIDLKVSPEKKAAFILTDTAIIWLKENKVVGKFRVLCVFELPDFDTIFTLNKVDHKFITPVELEVILKSTGLSTTRGIMASEISGTYLHGAVLPLVDVNALVRNQRKEREEKEKVTPK